MAPETRYARSGDVSIAYQVVGDGPETFTLISGWMSHAEHWWEEPSVVRFFERIQSFARLLIYDRRGSGLSDRVERPPTLDEEVEDFIAVLDDAGIEQVVVGGYALGGPLAVTLAHARPDRVRGLVLYAGIIRNAAAPDYEWALTPEEREEAMQRFLAGWGKGIQAPIIAPSRADDPVFTQWLARLERFSASPGTMVRLVQAGADLDVRDLLPEVGVPALVIHRTDDRLIDVRHSRYAADRIPGARYVELAGEDHLMTVGDTAAILDEVEEFVTGSRPASSAPRDLLTVMFTDIVDSTGHAARQGDTRWRDTLATHASIVRRELRRHAGTEVKSVGDGFLVTFAGSPSGAVRCAEAIAGAVAETGIDVRIGLHTGECEILDGDVGGMAVHIAARVGALAGAGEILVSGTTYGTVVGSGIPFVYRGSETLRGVPGQWPLFNVRRDG